MQTRNGKSRYGLGDSAWGVPWRGRGWLADRTNDRVVSIRAPRPIFFGILAGWRYREGTRGNAVNVQGRNWLLLCAPLAADVARRILSCAKENNLAGACAAKPPQIVFNAIVYCGRRLRCGSEGRSVPLSQRTESRSSFVRTAARCGSRYDALELRDSTGAVEFASSAAGCGFAIRKNGLRSAALHLASTFRRRRAFELCRSRIDEVGAGRGAKAASASTLPGFRGNFAAR